MRKKSFSILLFSLIISFFGGCDSLTIEILTSQVTTTETTSISANNTSDETYTTEIPTTTTVQQVSTTVETTEMITTNATTTEETTTTHVIVTEDENNNFDPVSDTLNDPKIDFSLNRGETFMNTNWSLEFFDIHDEYINENIPMAVFFYAFTYEEFSTKISEITYPAYSMYDGNIKYLNNKFETFDEAYFMNNILLFYYKAEPNFSTNYIYSVTREGNTLTVNINRFEGMMSVLSFWPQFVTIKKSDVADIGNVNFIVRTVSEVKSFVTAYISEDYLEDFYLNGKTLDDFENIENIASILTYTASLRVDLVFNKQIYADDLVNVIHYLENNPNVRSIGYKGTDFIRINLINSFYIEMVNKTLVITDFIDDHNFINNYQLSVRLNNFSPYAYIIFYQENIGEEYSSRLIADLSGGYYPFLDHVY